MERIRASRWWARPRKADGRENLQGARRTGEARVRRGRRSHGGDQAQHAGRELVVGAGGRMTTTTLQLSNVTIRERDVLGESARQVTFMRETEICEPAPIEAAGEGVVVRPEFMAIDQPY